MIGFLGLSHLGLVSAAAAAARGEAVVAWDPDAALVSAIRTGALPVLEPGLAEIVIEAGARFEPTDDAARLAECALLYVAVDVATADDGSSDVSVVESHLKTAARVARPGACVVVLSQVEPGFTRARRTLVEREGRRLLYQVETLVFGRAVERALAPERFIVGCADPGESLPDALVRYLARFGCPVLPMRYESAELAKIAINAFLVSTVSTTNMLAELTERLGADWAEVAPALRLDARIGPHAYLSPGLGIGGGNLPRDLATIDRLASEVGADVALVQAWRERSRRDAGWALRALGTHVLDGIAEPRIGLWGLSYKEHTRSSRGSTGLALAQSLAASGVDVVAYDPGAEPVAINSPTFLRVDEPLAACAGADALVIATPWPSFRAMDPEAIKGALRGDVVVDPYTVLDSDAVFAARLRHVRRGVPTC